jgi:hypothetical protein
MLARGLGGNVRRRNTETNGPLTPVSRARPTSANSALAGSRKRAGALLRSVRMRVYGLRDRMFGSERSQASKLRGFAASLTNENPGLATGVFCEGLVLRVLSSPLRLEELVGKCRFRRGAAA